MLTVMTYETTWTKDTHSKFGLLSYSPCRRNKKETEQIYTGQNLQSNRDIN